MKLKKINEEHYVVVDETIQPVNGYYYDFLINKIKSTNGAEYGEASHCWQITHSTQPIEIIHTSGVTMTNPPMGYINIIELPLSEVKELLGEVGLQIKAEKEREKLGYTNKFITGFVSGYNQALEDNKERKYTDEDLKRAFFNGGNMKEIEEFNYFIKSLQPKTEWEVDIINGKLTLKQ